MDVSGAAATHNLEECMDAMMHYKNTSDGQILKNIFSCFHVYLLCRMVCGLIRLWSMSSRDAIKNDIG